MHLNGVNKPVHRAGTGSLNAPPRHAQEAPAAAKAKTLEALQPHFGGLDRLRNAPAAGHVPMPWEVQTSPASHHPQHDQAYTEQYVADREYLVGEGAKKLSPQGRAAIAELSAAKYMGHLQSEQNSLTGQMATYLRNGGDPKTLETIARQILDPSRITQAAPHTCVAADLQKSLAKSNPGRYFRIMAGLTQGGTVKTADDRNAATLTLTQANRDAVDQAELSPDQTLNGYFQSAAMDLGDLKAHYHAADDTSHGVQDADTTAGRDTYKGLGWDSTHRLAHQIMGGHVANLDEMNKGLLDKINAGDQSPETRKGLYGFLQKELTDAKADGQAGVFIALNSKEGKHLVQLSSLNEHGAEIGDATGHPHFITMDHLLDRFSADFHGPGGIGTSTATVAQALGGVRGGR